MSYKCAFSKLLTERSYPAAGWGMIVSVWCVTRYKASRQYESGCAIKAIEARLSSGRRFLRYAVEFRVLAVVEVKGKHPQRAGLGLEAALVGRGGGVEVVRAFGEILLFLFVILADEEVPVLDGDGEFDAAVSAYLPARRLSWSAVSLTCLCSFSLGSGGACS
jgi:hypothetical protein